MSVKSRRVILAQGGGTPSFRIPTAPVVVTVANVVGLNVTAATTTLRNQGFVVTQTGTANAAVVNTVLSQSLAAGSSQPQGSPITLTISNGLGSGGTDFGSDLRAWMTQPGNQVLTLPGTIANPRTYTVGTVSTAHQHTVNLSGIYGGWLILKAEEVGGVTIEMKDTGFFSNPGDYRVMFIGMAFNNGMFTHVSGSNRWRWWYCTGTFPADEWGRQFIANGGTISAGDHTASASDTAALASMKNQYPDFLRNVNGANRSEHYGLYGCDFYEYGATALFFRRVNSIDIHGVRGWGDTEVVDGFNWDPNQDFANSADWFHCGSCGLLNSSNHPVIQDSCFGLVNTGTGPMVLGGDSGTSDEIDVNRIWLWNRIDTGTARGLYIVARNSVCTGTVQNVKVLNSSQATVIEQTQNTPVARFGASGGGGIFPVWSGFTTTYPSGVSAPGGVMSLGSEQNLLDHVDNPANIWRAANVIGSWATYFAGNWP